MKRKQKKPSSYNIFVVPEGKPTSKRFILPRWGLKALGMLALLWFVVTVAVASAAYYYRSGWLATAEIRSENEEMKASKSRVEEKLAGMEAVLSRADKLASRLESAIGINKKAILKDIGPISDDSDLPDPKKLTLADKYDLKAQGSEEPVTGLFEGLALKMDDLEESITSVELRLQEVYTFHQGKLAYWASIPSIWPVRGWVTSDFGPRRSPKGIGTRFHEGIDIAASIGTPVYASGDGVVTFSGYKHGFGNTIIIDHGFGITTIYGHNSSLHVSEGDRIKRGMSIASVGRTGRATGPHLHYEVVIDGVPVDPMRYIIENF